MYMVHRINVKETTIKRGKIVSIKKKAKTTTKMGLQRALKRPESITEEDVRPQRSVSKRIMDIYRASASCLTFGYLSGDLSQTRLVHLKP